MLSPTVLQTSRLLSSKLYFKTNRRRQRALGRLQGTVAGITYDSQGDGPPLILLPLSLASSQWDPLLSRLSTRCRPLCLVAHLLAF